MRTRTHWVNTHAIRSGQRYLVAQDEDLGILGPVGAGEQGKAAEQAERR
jgi:hypothetical protein